MLGYEGTPRDRALVALLVYAGLRLSGACFPKVAGLELRERSDLVRVRVGKNGRWREVPLNASARRELSAYLREHPRVEWPFPGKGGYLTPAVAQKTVSRYGRWARIPGVTPHVLRRTFCKSLVDAGDSVDRVAVPAGHSNLGHHGPVHAAVSLRHGEGGGEAQSGHVDEVGRGGFQGVPPLGS